MVKRKVADSSEMHVGVAIEVRLGMPKRHRICFNGAIYHVMSRGNRKSSIFLADRDRHRFLRIVRASIERYGALCYGYSLMGNHYHLVICTPRGNLSAVMRQINGLYSRYVNWRYNWSGHLFEGPFTAILVDDEDYLRNALAYVARNPVEAGLVKDAQEWTWSHHRAVMGKCATPSFLTTDWLASLFAADTLAGSRRSYADCVARPCLDVDFAVPVMAAPAVNRAVRAVVGATLYRARLPRSYRALGRPGLDELFAGVTRKNRRPTILRAHVVHGYQMTEIARYLDRHPTTISRIVARAESRR